MRVKGGLRAAPRGRVTPVEVLAGFRGTLWYIFGMSGVINVLALTGALYMLQIYDRALVSQSVPTLLALSLLAIGLYLFQGVLDVLRSQVLVRLGAKLDTMLAPLAHKVTIDMPRFGFLPAEARDRGRDVDTLRQFLGSQGPVALFDLPWMPLYLAFIYLLHPWLGIAVLGGALILTALTALTEVLTRQISQSTHKAALAREAIAESHSHNSEVLRAMGITGRAVERFSAANEEHLKLQTRANDITGSFGGLSKVLRLMLQSAVLGLGAYFTIKGELSAGAIIAASVASARALAPIDMAIGQWKGVVAARRAYRRLSDSLTVLDEAPIQVDLPRPAKSLVLDKVTVAAPSSGTVILSDITLELAAGQALGLIGASGSGKSSLARALTGVWPLARGNIRLDGAEIIQWSPDQLGTYLGYLPQDVAMFNATIAENISRLEAVPNSDKVLEASRAAGVHDMIVRLPKGYQTELGPHGVSLSAGQRQRVALARALYDNPFLVVLDEPNSNLDADGEAALTEAIKAVRNRGGIAIVIAHRPSALAAVDMVGVLREGKLVAFGPKEEIIQRPTGPRPVATTPSATATKGDGKWALPSS